MQTSNLVYTHPGQDQMQVEVILASTTNTGSPPIYTIRMRYPRPIHGEIMTHRVFGRNARSSRAVPVKTMLNEVRTIPYVPWHWGKNQKGMQADEECNELIKYDADSGVPMEVSREVAWLDARDQVAAIAEGFMEAGYHKQNPNRLLEPFSWIDTLITSTDWENFFWLREHHAAEPHLQDLARLVHNAMESASLITRDPDEWHMPYITYEERTKYHSNVLLKISAARCARISYKPFNGEASTEAELARADLLMNDERVHASPFEHQAKPDTQFENWGGEYQWENPELHGNLTGWCQYRKLIPNEVYHG